MAVGPTLKKSSRCSVLDIAFLGLTVVFFAITIGYVALCDRLMK